mgnify:FL=1
MNSRKKIFVTGGGGFLGTSICQQLIRSGYKVTSFSRKKYRHLVSIGVECYQGDLGNLNDLHEAMKSCDAVIHTAAKAGVWGCKNEFEKTNIEGTQNVIAAVKSNNINAKVNLDEKRF